MCFNTSATIANNIIKGNSADWTSTNTSDVGGGGILCYGSNSSTTKIISNTITDNYSNKSRGGGISCYQASPTIVNNLIARNSAGLYGGGIACELSSPTITNNTITQNTADGFLSGGGIYCWYSYSFITNNIITGNTATTENTNYQAGGIFSGHSSLTVNYNDVYNNITFDYTDYDKKHDIGGIANISSDPMFMNSSAGYHLQQGSPCIDKGDNNALGLAGITSDLDGNPRFVDGDGDGYGDIDMGAYECAAPPTPAYTLTVIFEGTGSGTVSLNPPEGTYDSGTVVTLTAEPAANSEFAGWSGDLGGTDNQTTITMNGNKNVTATFNVLTYTITATAGEGGSISPSGAVSVNHGADQAFTITADTGYNIADVVVDGSSVGAVSTYTFTNVTSAHTISAAFSLLTYTITSTAGEGGSISPSGAVSVNHGANQAFAITADAGYRISDVVVDGSSIGAVSSYTFIKVAADHTIQAAFIKTYTITPSAGPGGTISPSEPVIVDKGGSCVFTITPDPGYHIAEVKVDDKSIGQPSSYTFRSVNADHTIQASFIKIYTITASAGPGGSIYPSGSFHVPYGHSRIFLIKPDRGYHIDDVKVDDVSVGQVSFYIFKKVDADHTIHATFARNEVLSAVVAIDPNTLNLKSKSDQNAITAYIELPKGYDVEHIIVATVKMDVMGTMVSAQLFPSWVDDHDHDRVPDRMVKFSRHEVIAALAGRTGDITLTVSGQLIGGMTFSGKDTIKVK
jgi:hypothetical protein